MATRSNKERRGNAEWGRCAEAAARGSVVVGRFAQFEQRRDTSGKRSCVHHLTRPQYGREATADIRLVQHAMLRRAALALVVSLPLILSEKAVLDDEDLLPSYIRSIAYSQAHTMKQRYAAHPQDAKYGGSTAARWWTDNWDPSVRCLLDKRIGNHGDGGKYVCDPDILLESDECVVYSVGR